MQKRIPSYFELFGQKIIDIFFDRKIVEHGGFASNPGRFELFP